MVLNLVTCELMREMSLFKQITLIISFVKASEDAMNYLIVVNMLSEYNLTLTWLVAHMSLPLNSHDLIVKSPL